MSKEIKSKEIKAQGVIVGSGGDGSGKTWAADASIRSGASANVGAIAGLRIKVTQEQIDAAREWLKGHLANTICSIGVSSYDAGTIDRLGADIRAIDRMEAVLGSVPSAPRKFRTDEDIRKDAQAAALEHTREEERKERARD